MNKFKRFNLVVRDSQNGDQWFFHREFETVVICNVEKTREIEGAVEGTVISSVTGGGDP